MRKAEQQNIINIIKGYCDIDQTVEDLANNMGTDGVSFVEGGGLAIYNVDMLQELVQVYGSDFKPMTYLSKFRGGMQAPDFTGEVPNLPSDTSEFDWKYKNGMPYVFTVYCQKFGQVLNSLVTEDK